MGNDNSCPQKTKINSNKHQCNTKTQIPQKYIKKLHNIKIRDLDIEQLISKVIKSKRGKITKPFIIIVSPTAIKNVKQRKNVITVIYKTHKDIRTGVMDQIKLHFASNKHKYDGLIVKLLCIISTSDARQQQVQSYYDLNHQPRHIDTLRKTIKLKLSHIPVIMDSGSCVVFNPNVKNSRTPSKFRGIHIKKNEASTITEQISKSIKHIHSVRHNKKNSINSNVSEETKSSDSLVERINHVEEKHANNNFEQKENALNPSIGNRLQEIAYESVPNINIELIIQYFEKNNIDSEWFKHHTRNDLVKVLKKLGISHGVSIKIWNAFSKNDVGVEVIKYLKQQHQMDQEQIKLLEAINECLENKNNELTQENSELRRIVHVAMHVNDADSSDESQYENDNSNDDEKKMDIGSLGLDFEYDSLLRALNIYYTMYQRDEYCNQLSNSNDCIRIMKEVAFVLWVLYLFMEFQTMMVQIFLMLHISNK